jgi:aspartate kinase
LVWGIQRSQVHFDFVCGAGENGRTAAGAEKPSGVVACFAVDRHSILRKYGGSVEKRPMMLAAVETVTKADPVRESRRHNSNIAAQAAAGESVHAASPPRSRERNVYNEQHCPCNCPLREGASFSEAGDSSNSRRAFLQSGDIFGMGAAFIWRVALSIQAAPHQYITGIPERYLPMARIVMKFGGTSVADIDRIRNVARHVKREVDAGHEVAVVVSAMAGKTNELVAWTRQTSPMHDAREYDAIVASGEQVTAGLLAIALQAMGVHARSWQGWQIPIKTDNAHGAARILDIDGSFLIERFAEGQVAVISGFQGIGPDNRISTLGRGGSDTSAVAIAASVKADRCDIYTDVDGVYTTDPRVEPKARRLSRISFEEMLEMASLGAKVLQVRSVELAMVHKVRTFVRSSFEDPDAPGMGDLINPPGTLICDEEEIVEQQVVTGIAYAKDEAQISLRRVADRPGISAAIFGPLAESHINVDMIVQNVSEDGTKTDMTFTVPSGDLDKALVVLEKVKAEIGCDIIQSEAGMVKVSVIGIGMRSHAGVAATAFRALADKGINIRAITTSEIKISILIDGPYAELAVRTLHSVYGLDKH